MMMTMMMKEHAVLHYLRTRHIQNRLVETNQIKFTHQKTIGWPEGNVVPPVDLAPEPTLQCPLGHQMGHWLLQPEKDRRHPSCS